MAVKAGATSTNTNNALMTEPPVVVIEILSNMRHKLPVLRFGCQSSGNVSLL